MQRSRRGEVDPFIVMDVVEAARKAEEAGRHIIHMEVGQPGTGAPRGATQAVARALAEPMGYTTTLGLPALRSGIAALYRRWYGVDLDPALIAEARRAEPGPDYVVGDLAGFELPSDGPQTFDAILCAGNVMGFLHPATRRPVLAGFRDRLAPAGRGVVGFGAGRGYDFDDFFADVDAVGLTREQTFATWDLRPFTDQANFVVAVLSAG